MITYNTQGTSMPDIDQTSVTAWIERVARAHGRRVGDINFIFVDDETILQINREFVHHDYYTDHIGFDYCEADFLSGDIYISLDTVRTNAPLVGATYDDELHRVIIHGVLHLCGIDDKGPDERAVMEAEEDRALAMR